VAEAAAEAVAAEAVAAEAVAAEAVAAEAVAAEEEEAAQAAPRPIVLGVPSPVSTDSSPYKTMAETI